MDTLTLSEPEVQAIWAQTCTELQPHVSPAVFNTWIMSNPMTELKLVGENQAVATITSPTAFHANNIKKNLYDQIKSSLDRVVGKETQLEFKIGTPRATSQQAPTTPAQPTHQTQPTQPNQQPSTTATPTALEVPLNTHSPEPSQSFLSSQESAHLLANVPQPTTPAQSWNQFTAITPAAFANSHSVPTTQPATSPNQNYQSYQPTPPTKARSNTPSGSPRLEDLFSPQTMKSVAMDRALVVARQVGLRPDYTFETFAVSTTNEMAHAAATAVSNRPGTAYNPLFLYGGVGVGKTHLMQAIGNNIIKNNPDLRVLYSTGEEFTNEIVSAIQTKKGIKFKEKFRTAQVLLIDDVQFIAGKNAVQEEFFHTFNALTKQASQIVLTSDRSPHEINLLEDRLRSRFEAGLMIDIQQPSFELRTAILLIKSSALNLSIPMELAQLIASKVDSARKIEGIITSIRSEVELKKRPIDHQLISEILDTEIDKKRPTIKVSPNDVLRAVANHFHVKQAAIKGQQRVQQIVQARHVAMYLLREDLQLPLEEIGRWFSNRDHTSALHAIKKINLELAQNELLRRDVSALRMSLTAVSR